MTVPRCLAGRGRTRVQRALCQLCRPGSGLGRPLFAEPVGQGSRVWPSALWRGSRGACPPSRWTDASSSGWHSRRLREPAGGPGGETVALRSLTHRREDRRRPGMLTRVARPFGATSIGFPVLHFSNRPRPSEQIPFENAHRVSNRRVQDLARRSVRSVRDGPRLNLRAAVPGREPAHSLLLFPVH